MASIMFRRATWAELEDKWQDLVREAYHPDYNGMGESYHAVTTASQVIENMKAYIADIPVWGAWEGDILVGMLIGRIAGERLVLYDLFVSNQFRRQGIGRQLVELAIRESGARTICAEVNQENSASQALFRSLNFQRKLTSDWLELHIPTEEK